MGETYVPSVRIRRLPNPFETNVAEYLAERPASPPATEEIHFVARPLRDDEKADWLRLRKQVIDALDHAPIGGGVVVHIKLRGNSYRRGVTWGVGKTCPDAARIGNQRQSSARAMVADGVGSLSEFGLLKVDGKSLFLWIEKAGIGRVEESPKGSNRIWGAKGWFSDPGAVSTGLPNHTAGSGPLRG